MALKLNSKKMQRVSNIGTLGTGSRTGVLKPGRPKLLNADLGLHHERLIRLNLRFLLIDCWVGCSTFSLPPAGVFYQLPRLQRPILEEVGLVRPPTCVSSAVDHGGSLLKSRWLFNSRCCSPSVTSSRLELSGRRLLHSCHLGSGSRVWGSKV